MAKNIEDIDFEILWEGIPCGPWDKILSFFHLNFTKYQITKDELIIITGFLHRKSNTHELYTLKDPDISESIFQRMFKVGTVEVKVDSHSGNRNIEEVLYLHNLKNPLKVRKLLRDAIEDDVMERKITYFDKV